MSRIFNPSKCVDERALRAHRGFVSRAEELPVADVKYFGLVIFCAEDKHFYECQHVVTATEDYYRWVAVTSGAQRTFFVPVEALTETEIPTEASMTSSIRTCCFDAIASATDEIALGLFRYGIKMEFLCHRVSFDSKYVPGKKYYIFNDSYDRAEFIVTQDVVPVEDKPYYIPDESLRYKTITFSSGESFDPGITYYESTRPRFVLDPDASDNANITHRVFESNGKQFNDLTKRDLVSKINELVELVNVTGCKISKVEDSGNLFDLCVVINKLIDELNPFAKPWNNLLNRVTELENQLSSRTMVFPYHCITNDGVRFKLDAVAGSSNEPTLTWTRET